MLRPWWVSHWARPFLLPLSLHPLPPSREDGHRGFSGPHQIGSRSVVCGLRHTIRFLQQRHSDKLNYILLSRQTPFLWANFQLPQCVYLSYLLRLLDIYIYIYIYIKYIINTYIYILLRYFSLICVCVFVHIYIYSTEKSQFVLCKCFA